MKRSFLHLLWALGLVVSPLLVHAQGSGCVRPNAGNDVTICLPLTATTLAAVTTGGSWAAQGGNPAAATIDATSGAITGLTVPGIYTFLYSVTTDGHTCTDDIVVTVNTSKPDAGVDQTLSCINAGANQLATTTTLTGSPGGGTWTPAGGPAAATVTAGGAVAGMTAVGTYQFIYTIAGPGGCSDTVAVHVNACAACVKPNAGADISVCFPATTAKLTAGTAGGSWAALGINPGETAIDTLGAIAGLSVPGTYQYIYSVTGGGITCSDTVNVFVITKPNAGADQTLACADNLTNLLTTTTTLTAITPGGSWTAQGTNPVAATVTVGGVVAGLSVAGIYHFIYSLNGCSDTVAVTVQACLACVKPNAGVDVSVCLPLATVKLTAITLAGTWAAQGGNPAGAIIDALGNITGLSTPGTYHFIYSLVGGGLTCSDTVSVVVYARPVATDLSFCGPTTGVTLTANLSGGVWSVLAGNPAGVTITVGGVVSGLTTPGIYNFLYLLNGCSDTASITIKVKPNAGADQTLACVNVGTNQLATTATLTGSPGAGTWTALTGPAVATVTVGGAVTGLTLAGIYQFVYTLNGCSDTVAVTVQPCTAVTVDLHLLSFIDQKIKAVGEPVTYTVKIWNESANPATGVEVTDLLNPGFQYISSSATQGSYNPVTKIWTVGTLAAQDTLYLTIQGTAVSSGVWFNTAEVSKSNENDADSTPNNGNPNEDDQDSKCFSVPYLICSGQHIIANVPDTYTGVQWFQTVGNTITKVADGNSLSITQIGSYSFTATNGTCPAEGCCPILVQAGDCCKPDLCIPFVLAKRGR